jgi:cellulose synthase/poly-beta-1,6-N-acetylglucosamine synthase-like glycosyltransferase
MPDKKSNNPVALLILAHNESAVIEGTVQAIQKAIAAGDTLFVVADHCGDDTETKAKSAGANVLIRNGDSPGGKGDALSWFVKEHRSSLKNFSRLVILDADSKIEPDFLDRVKENITNDCAVVQCFVHPEFESNSPIGKLAALSEFHDQYISDGIRTALGWPVRLRGTGMIIKPDLLFELDGQLNTNVEDIALSLIFASNGIRVKRLDQAVVLDPKPPSMDAAARQRARWFRGQWGAVFLKPKWLVLTASLIMALILFPWPWASIPFGFIFVSGSLYLFVGLCIIPERGLFLRTLLHIPAYVWMWLRGIIISLRTSSWLRVRK